MTSDDLSAEKEMTGQDSPQTPAPEPDATANPPAPPSEVQGDSKPAVDSEPSVESSRTASRRWLADLFLAFRRHVSQLLIPLVLLAAITAIVVSLGSGLLLLGKSELEIGPIALAWAVVAAALAVLLIGLSALWLAARAGRSTPSHR